MSSGVVRGGRPTAATTTAEAKAQQDAAVAATERRLNDVRTLLHHPEFVRYVRHWIAQSNLFAPPIGLPHDQVREALGRADLGLKMWNEIIAADKARVIDLLDLTHPTAPTGVSHD